MKKIISILLLIMFIVFLTACAKEKAAPEQAQAKEATVESVEKSIDEIDTLDKELDTSEIDSLEEDLDLEI